MDASLVVHFFLFVFSFCASIIQGVTGFGDAILLQVVWYTATVFSPDIFNNTALGDSPVRAVTLLMYCRIVFSAPVLAYMSLKGGVFSLQMTIAMAVPSTITALIGIFIFRGATSEELKLVLGISGLIFAGLYVVTLVTKYVLKKRKLQQLSSAGGTEGEATAVTIVPETEAVEADLNASRNASFARPPGEAASPTLVSLSTGSPYRRHEAQPRVVTEAGGGAEVPPLTPSKLSPSHTMSYTHVRVNRNLDENGKIKMSTKIGASVASLVSGIMGSLTGVGGPPQIIFILLFDVPQYIIRVNFAMQSVPSALLRFLYACFAGLFTKAMIPLFITSLISGYAGLYVGFKLGKMLGPRSYSIFVLILLLLSSLVMITKSVAVLISFTVIVFAITIISAVYEHKQISAQVQRQIEMEKELADLRRQEEEEQQQQQQQRAVQNAAESSASAPRVRSSKAAGGNGGPMSTPAINTVAHTPVPLHSPVGGSLSSSSSAVPSSEKTGMQRSRNPSDPALADCTSVTTGVSSRTSSRVRRSDRHRPPPLWKESDGRQATVVSVPPAGAVAAAAAAQKVRQTGERRGMASEEVKRWVAAQEEELDERLSPDTRNNA